MAVQRPILYHYQKPQTVTQLDLNVDLWVQDIVVYTYMCMSEVVLNLRATRLQQECRALDYRSDAY